MASWTGGRGHEQVTPPTRPGSDQHLMCFSKLLSPSVVTIATSASRLGRVVGGAWAVGGATPPSTVTVILKVVFIVAC